MHTHTHTHTRTYTASKKEKKGKEAASPADGGKDRGSKGDGEASPLVEAVGERKMWLGYGLVVISFAI